jgi:uncharacterized protein YdhG (YjbR/CyaY superfamily)
MSPKPTTIAEYLAPLPREKRAALQKLRKDIRAAVPSAEECISYGLPGFRYGGKLLTAFGAAANHCALYGAIPATSFKDLAAYDTSRGTIRFDPARPMPTALVRRLMKARVAEIEARKAAFRSPAKKPKRR